MNRPRWLLSSSEYNFLHPAFWFGDVDARPLALFRMAFALLMLKEAVYRIFVADMWYGDAGMFPLRLLPRIAPDTPTLMSGLNETWMVIGFLVSVFAPIGDLVESQLKRTFGVKDSGNIMPGHGGFLDRFDSLLVAAPLVWIYVTFF